MCSCQNKIESSPVHVLQTQKKHFSVYYFLDIALIHFLRTIDWYYLLKPIRIYFVLSEFQLTNHKEDNNYRKKLFSFCRYMIVHICWLWLLRVENLYCVFWKQDNILEKKLISELEPFIFTCLRTIASIN